MRTSPASAIAFDVPAAWSRLGLQLPRNPSGFGHEVVGDPAIVWDEDLPGWRMFLFCAPPGHGQAVCRTTDRETIPTAWEKPAPLDFANPADLFGGTTHKPVVVVEAAHPNRAARIAGRYCLLGVSFRGAHKVVQRAWATTLAGPWTVEPGAFIDIGADGDFDGKHADAVNGVWFPERGELLVSYMGYPLRAQPRAISPWGSAQAMAVASGTGPARKLGAVLAPCQIAGHWASGWVGGLQLIPGRTHRWVALINASPIAPRPEDGAISREEPPPSLGGFAVCDEEWPVRGWRWCDRPIIHVADLEPAALADGEGVNCWRHHLLLTGAGAAVYYNSGSYGREQLYARTVV